MLGALALGAAAGRTSDGRAGGTLWLAHRRFADVDVSLADCSDNPIAGQFGRTAITRADCRWASTTWNEVIRPGLYCARVLERTLADSRAHWNDPTRLTFDQRFAVVILGDAKQTLAELQQLAAAVRLLASSGRQAGSDLVRSKASARQ